MTAVVVLPTYNEIGSLESIVTGIVRHDARVLIVDDASPDGTGDLADDLAGRIPAVSVLHRLRKSGLGRAYAAGFERALASGTDVVCEMDADGSHDPAHLPRLLGAVLDGAGLAIGSRFVAGGEFVGVSMRRRVLSRAGNLYSRLALGLPVRDATSGFRAYDSGVLRAVMTKPPVADGYAFQIEMAWRAHRAGARIDEVPIAFRGRTHGRSKMELSTITEAFGLVSRWGLSRLRGDPKGSEVEEPAG